LLDYDELIYGAYVSIYRNIICIDDSIQI